MTNEQIQILTLLGIIVGSVIAGFALGKPYWHSKGYVEGLKEGGDMYCGIGSFDHEDLDPDPHDRLLNARYLTD